MLSDPTGDGLLQLDGELLATGTFERQGADLVISSADGGQLVVADYFSSSPPADLVTTSGEVVAGELIAALAGPQTPGQYAQAGDGGAGGTPIGEVEEMAGTVTATRVDGTEVALAPGMPVFQGDVIQTGPEGKLSLLFADGTQFSLSPAARMVLDELVYDPDAGTGSFLLSVVRGAFVFITGQIAGTGPGAMEVETPAGVLGIRGTQVGCTIGAEDGATACALMVEADGHVGEVIFVNDTSSILLTQPYETVIAPSRDSTLMSRQLDLDEVRSLLAGALGEGGLPEAEAGLLEKTGAATFETLASDFLGGAGLLLTPLGPLPDVSSMDDVALDSEPEIPFLLEAPEEDEPPLPPPTEIRPGQTTAVQPLQIAVVEQDLGNLVDFPVIPDGTNVFTTGIFANQGLSLFGDPRSLTFDNPASGATVTLIDDSGRFQNTLGAYVVEADGRIGPPELIFPNASVVGGGGELIAGESSAVIDNQGRGFTPGMTLSLFILADGFRQNPILQQVDPDDLTLRFDEAAGGDGGLFPGVPDVADDGLQLVAVTDNGQAVPLDGTLYHTAAHFQGVPVDGQLIPARGLNDDQPDPGSVPLDGSGQPINQHYLAGTDGIARLRLGFEDLPFERSDFDFGDLVLDVRAEPSVSPSVEPQPFGFAFNLANTSSDLVELRAEIDNPAPGDRFSLGDGFTVSETGAVLRGQTATGIRLDQEDPTTWRFGSNDPVGIEVYEDVLNAIGLSTDLASPTGTTRILEIEVTDPSGVESTHQVRFIVPGAPLIGTTRADELTGTGSNDALFGLDGDDLLIGGAGDDLLVGGPGADGLRGGPGADLLRIDGIAEIDADGDGQVDFIDLALDFTPSEGDLLDLGGLLDDLGPGGQDARLDFARAADGSGVDLRIDLAGVGNFQPIIRLLGGADVAEIESALVLPA
ncbi:MAG: FecR domain-containing protein [Geminicoccaceae bacterium]|nr:FecR domain-containing protein [Geminicoccaceae bacterium]